MDTGLGKREQLSGRFFVHTVYGGANLFSADRTAKLGRYAFTLLDRIATDDTLFAAFMGLTQLTWRDLDVSGLRKRVATKLAEEPVEDLRVDFEDGYGLHDDREEDHEAERVGAEVAKAVSSKIVPRGFGIRLKSIATHTVRSLRTLEIFCTHTFARGWTAQENQRFVVTLPKVESAEEVTTLHEVLNGVESKYGLAEGMLGIEVMVESARGLRDIRRIVHGNTRVRAAHFGAYDYAACIGLAEPTLGHPSIDFARKMLVLALADTPITVSDGATLTLPILSNLPDNSRSEHGDSSARDAFQLHTTDIVRALRDGIVQGWDLHPAQLLSRYAATYTFYRNLLSAQAKRLQGFVEKQQRAVRLGVLFDDRASIRSLAVTLSRGVQSGAYDESELSQHLGGVSLADIL